MFTSIQAITVASSRRLVFHMGAAMESMQTALSILVNGRWACEMGAECSETQTVLFMMGFGKKTKSTDEAS